MKKLLPLLLLFSVSLNAQYNEFERMPLRDGIRVNSIGFLPDFPKGATVVGASDEISDFSLIRAADETVVFEGELGAKWLHEDSAEWVRSADFSSITDLGEYFIRVAGLPDSAVFRIAEDVYNRSMLINMIGFYGQRCGVPVKFEHDGVVFEKKACHLDDGYLDFYDPERAGEIKDGCGGWHDAGDYGKYIVNAAFSTGIMLSAWEHFGEALNGLTLPIPESGGSLPDYLAELKFNIDWMLKMQFEDGRVSHKLTRQNFGAMQMPSEDKEKRFFVPWGTDATACLAAVTAQAARVFEPYDADYAAVLKDAASKAMEANMKQWWDQVPDQSAFRTGGYHAPASHDKKWALAEYWLLTGEERILPWLIDAYREDNYVVDVNFDWGKGRNIGAISLLNSDVELDPNMEALLKHDFLQAADRVLDQIETHGYRRGIRSHYWGVNGGIARLAMNLYTAYQISGEKKYLNAIVAQLDYLYGRNPYGRSFVTGEGSQPPMFPHHRPSEADGITEPWPGHLIGGANPTELDWHDVMPDARTNENAINWDASINFALAIFYKGES